MKTTECVPKRSSTSQLERLARERADQQARRIPWQRLSEVRNQYIDWQEFYLWVRSVLEVENHIPDWLLEILNKRCPGFVENEKKMRPKEAKNRPAAMVWGVSLPWNLLTSAALGIWLMFALATLGSTGAAAHSDQLVGALIVTVAVIALAEVGRVARFVNVLFGTWIILAPWVLGGAAASVRWNGLIAGALVILFSFPRGKIGERYGSFERYIR